MQCPSSILARSTCGSERARACLMVQNSPVSAVSPSLLSMLGLLGGNIVLQFLTMQACIHPISRLITVGHRSCPRMVTPSGCQLTDDILTKLFKSQPVPDRKTQSPQASGCRHTQADMSAIQRGHRPLTKSLRLRGNLGSLGTRCW